MIDNDALYKNVHNYTKYKIVQILIDKYKDTKLDNINLIEQLSDDILKVLAICGMKYYNELNEDFSSDKNKKKERKYENTIHLV